MATQRKTPGSSRRSWQSGPWRVRTDQMFLMPGDSPMGLRLPLTSLPTQALVRQRSVTFPLDPLAERVALPDYEQIRGHLEPFAAPADWEWQRAHLSGQPVLQHLGNVGDPGDSSAFPVRAPLTSAPAFATNGEINGWLPISHRTCRRFKSFHVSRQC